MNPAPLHAELDSLRELVGTLKAALELSRQENTLLRQKIDLLVRRVFGSSSERLDRAQLELLLQLPVLAETTTPVTVLEAPKALVSRSRKDHAPRLPDNLPVVEEVIEPEPVKVAPEKWRCIGQEVSEQLDYEPARFLRRRTIRKKYVSRVDLDLAPVIAPLPECLQERGVAAPGLLAQVLVSKYCDHLPLYRQEQIFLRRHQVHLPRQTLARWVALAADWLKPIYEQIRTGVMAGGYVQVDETPVNYLEPGLVGRGRAIFGRAAVRKGMCFFAGKPAAPPRAWTMLFPQTSPARCNVMAMRPIGRLPTVAARRLNWPVAGHMCAGSFTKPWSPRQKPQAGSSGKSNSFTKSNPVCGNTGPAQSCVPRCAPTKAGPSWTGCSACW